MLGWISVCDCICCGYMPRVVYVVCLGGIRRAAASISGPFSYKKLKFEAGVHRVQRVPKTESKGRIHTSTMTVAILPQPTEVQKTSALIDIQKRMIA